MRVLLVENHVDTANYLRAYLMGLGHDTCIAESLAAARATLKSSEFDLLLSDISLPDGPGWDLKAELAELSIFAIAMSGHGTDGDRKMSLAAGFRYHLIKPFLPSELDSILDEAEASRRSFAPA